MTDVRLRDVVPADLPILFEHQRDPEANRLAAFVSADPDDRAAFEAKWARILRDDAVPAQAIVAGGELAGSILCWRDPALPGPEVSYWLGRAFWGGGIATRALALFLEQVPERPLYGRTAEDNAGSRRVLEKNGFVRVGASADFAQGRGEEVVELLLELR